MTTIPDTDLADRYGATLFLLAHVLGTRHPDAQAGQLTAAIEQIRDLFPAHLVEQAIADLRITAKTIRQHAPNRETVSSSFPSARGRVRTQALSARDQALAAAGLRPHPTDKVAA